MRHSRKRRHHLRERFGKLDRGQVLRLAAISVASILLATSASIAALAEVARTRNPALVARLTDDPTAPLLSLQRQLYSSPGRILGKDIEAAGREALRRQALNSLPLRMLALRADALKDPKATATFARLSERVTRHDLLTQLVLVELAVRANDHELALRHYDKALRTTSEGRTILFPILSSAIANDAIRRGMVPYVRAGASWVPEFVQFALRDGTAGPRETAKLLLLSGAGKQKALMDAAGATLIGELVDDREFGLARQLFLQMPGTSPRFFQDASFNSNTTNPKFGLLAWNSVGSALTGAAIEGPADSSRRNARFFASSGERGVLLRRVLGLQPGRYYLNETRSRVVGDREAHAYWELKCPVGADLKTIWRGPAASAPYKVSRVTGPTIPDGCPNQILELNAVAGDGPEGLEAVIEDFQLQPMVG